MTEPAAIDDYTALVGMPTMEEFIKLARRSVSIEQDVIDERSLVREWRTANDYFLELQATEAGWVDESHVEPLPESMIPSAQRASDDPALQMSAEPVPSSWALVELDRLAVFQKRVNVTYVNALTAALPLHPVEDDIVQFAIKPAIDAASMQSARLSHNAFAFMSESNDLRLVDAALLDAAMVGGYRPRGRATKVIGLFVGLSVNYLSAIRFENRVLLINGNHRACALRQRGINHAPCLLFQLSREEDLDLMNMHLPREDEELFLRGSRPPLLKDYFDPRLSKTLRLPRHKMLLNIQFSVDSRNNPMD